MYDSSQVCFVCEYKMILFWEMEKPFFGVSMQRLHVETFDLGWDDWKDFLFFEVNGGCGMDLRG